MRLHCFYFVSVAENQSCRASIVNIAKCFAPMIIGHSRSPAEDGLKKLQDVKEQQMVFTCFVDLKILPNFLNFFNLGYGETPQYSRVRKLPFRHSLNYARPFTTSSFD